ncbi:MAG: PAP/fibrillin family protein [Cyanobacteria bacterium P01_D01_bin.105]
MPDRDELKTDLKRAIAPQNRGIRATADDRTLIASLIARIEALNPTPAPLSAPDLLAGDWRLLYTTSAELLGIDRVPLAQLGEIYQCVRPAESQIFNIAEINSLPYCEALVSVVAGFVPADVEGQVSTRRVNVRFNRGVIGLQRILGYRSPAQYIAKLENTEKLNWLQGFDFEINSNRQQGWLEVTYLDEDMRIGRGNQGSLFVLAKS